MSCSEHFIVSQRSLHTLIPSDCQSANVCFTAPQTHITSVLRQMPRKFRPPTKRSAEADTEYDDRSVPKAKVNTSEPKKKKSQKKDKPKTSVTPQLPVKTKVNEKPKDNSFVFGVANGDQTSVKVDRIKKMTKKFGVVDGKGLDPIEEECQTVPQTNEPVVETTADDISVPQMPITVCTLKDIDWADFADLDDFFDPD